MPAPPPPRREDGLAALAKAHAELRSLQIENDRLREQIRGRDAHIAELKTTLTKDVGEVDRLRAELKARDEEVERLKQQPVIASGVVAGDDLKLIRGIGPGFERTLKANGVTTHAQVAAWTNDDVLRIAALLNTQPGRITKGEWVEQAAALNAK